MLPLLQIQQIVADGGKVAVKDSVRFASASSQHIDLDDVLSLHLQRRHSFQ